MIPNAINAFNNAACIPRESGDDPCAMSADWAVVPYSPRERG